MLGKSPAVGAVIEKAVIAKVVVGIRDQHAEHDAPPEHVHVALRFAKKPTRV